MSQVIYEKFDRYAIFTLNRPEALNALSDSVREEFAGHMEDFNKDPAMRVGIVTGNGRAFCAGGDLKEMAQHRLDPSTKTSTVVTLGQFGESSRPFIAAVNGPAIAGGFEWTLDCDIRICTPEAYFAQWEIRRGMAPSFGIHHLPRYIPFGEAMVMLLTGRPMSSEEALRWGFVHQIVPRDQLLPHAVQLAQDIASLPAVAVQASRELAREWLKMGENPGMVDWVRRAVSASRDHLEGPLAFSEKRQPEWTER